MADELEERTKEEEEMLKKEQNLVQRRLEEKATEMVKETKQALLAKHN